MVVHDKIERQLLENWPRLFGYAVTLTRDRDRASDLLQQAALAALSATSPPQEPVMLRAWLFKIVRNNFIDGHRRTIVESKHAATSIEETEVWGFDDRVIAALSVRQGLDRLAPDHREIIELVDIQGFRYAEVSDILGVPLGTVMSRLSRARLALLDVIGGTVRSLDRARRRSRGDRLG